MGLVHVSQHFSESAFLVTIQSTFVQSTGNPINISTHRGFNDPVPVGVRSWQRRASAAEGVLHMPLRFATAVANPSPAFLVTPL